jgi:hypothetical protein
LRARRFSKIKGKSQYNQRKASVQSKENISTIKEKRQYNRRRATVQAKERKTPTNAAFHLLRSFLMLDFQFFIVC